MKYFVSIAVFALVLFVPLITHAQTAAASGNATGVSDQQAAGTALGNAINAGISAIIPGGGVAVAAAQAGGGFVAQQAGNAILGGIEQLVYWLMMGVAFLLGIVGTLFNWLVVITIFQFSLFFGNSSGLLLAWGILRDIGNILILFGFLYAGLMIVLDLHSFDARKSIPRLIIFALLLNFSLFTGEAIIDVSNVLGAKIYQEAGSSIFAKCTNTSDVSTCVKNPGIAEVIMQDTFVGSAFSFNDASGSFTVNSNNTSPNNLGNVSDMNKLFAYFGIITLMVIVMMLLLTASIMFVLRAITLTILLVASPIGFAGMAVPMLESQAEKWWHTLISNAFFAPIFLLLLFIGLKVMDGFRSSIDPNFTLLKALSQPDVSIGSILIIFAMICGFFMAALMFAKSSGAAGAQFATSFAQKTVIGGFSGMGRNVGSFVGRNTAGRAAKFGKRKFNETMGDLKHRPGITGFIAKQGDYLVGQKISDSLGNLEKGKYGGQSLKDVEDAHEHRDHETHEAHDNVGKNKVVGTALAMEKPAGDSDEDKKKRRDRDVAIAKALGDMTQAQREQSSYFKKATAELSDVVRNLSTNDYEALLKSDKVAHDIKDAMKELRFNEANAHHVISRMTPEAVAGLSGSTLRKDHVLKAMSGRQFATIDPAKHDSETIAKIVEYLRTAETKPDTEVSPEAKKEVRKFKALVGTDGGDPVVSVNPNAKNRWVEFFPPKTS